MAKEKMPYEIIQELAVKYDKLSEAKVLAKLRAIPPLPGHGRNSDNPEWDEPFWDDVAYHFLGLCRVLCARQLREAIPLILDRVCFGDPGEAMRGTCHILEGIVRPNWSELTPYCVAALKSERPGTRLWTAHQLGRLRDPEAIPALEAAINDPEPEVRKWVQRALECTREAVAAAAKPTQKQTGQRSARKAPRTRKKGST